ncbi:hypothetical protein OG883_09330 [Streptomyces sp. NBC_01142]|uniref:tetratricopeptide repeat protein n=1 Tax=Streptomyces sp. NBC_01142 TaxID=2975865 RepID=UPI002256D39E|nr:hypothetical protein [Streptomyces sp. NBC_01142]MCX4820103.1 hypothetical protein [Streptomyces sp. NBC_01142]
MTSRRALENRPDVLWRMVGHLWSRLEEGERLTQGQLDAVVEGFFRIGVHPGTDPPTALRLLARAHRLDGSNPKHPYHVGLLYLRHGRPEAAVRWLTAAAALSPVNHRIWAHLSLAYRGLHEHRKDTPDYTGEDRARAEAIAGTVRAGRDDFDPEAAEPTLPLLRPGECRWTGIHDMAADGRLHGTTAERTRDVLAAELEGVAELAGRRRGGCAAFTVLAVQWMVYGYPTATVRRLAKRLPPDDGPATRMLDLVCDLLETDRGELPDRLAACLADRSLPDLLVALLHRRRLFWRPLRFPDLGAHAAAREFTDGDPARHEKALQSAWNALGAGPPEPMADVPNPSGPAEPEATGPDERLVMFEEVAARLTGVVDHALAHAKLLGRTTVGDEADFRRISGDKDVLTEMVDRLETSRKSWLEALQRFKDAEPTGLVMAFEDFRQRVEECEARFQKSPGSVRKVLDRKVGRNLAARQKEFGSAAPAPSEHALALEERLSDLEAQRPSAAPADGPAATGQRPSSPPPPADAGARERVAHALDAAERRLDDNFAEAWQTLDAYPARLRNGEAVTLLRAYLGGHQAEAELRLGRTTAARRRWSGMLTDDPLHPGVLRNLAVAHTSAGDLGPAAQAWSRYLEALYLRDMLAGDIRRGAADRAELHGVLAGSFGTAALYARSAPGAELDGDVRQIAPVLAGTGKVAITVAHLRLEELNHTLSHRSPTLLLGVGRSVGEAELAAARDRRTTAVEAAVRALPARVRDPFEKLCRQAVDEAHREASETNGRTRRPGDEAEEQAHMDWARGRILWKLRIAKGVMGADADWPLTEYSGDVIRNLRLIDELPLDAADEAVLRSAQQLGTPGDPKKFVERHNQLSELACRFALGQIFEASEESASGAATHDFPDRFRRIGRSWGRNSDAIPEEYADRLDDPTRLYQSSARSAFAILGSSGAPTDDRERGIVAAAVTGLERWVKRLPGATGPARALAALLSSLDRHDEALEVLATARDEAFGPLGRDRLAVSFVRLDIARGRFAVAVTQVRTLLESGPDDEQLRHLLTRAYQSWINSGEDTPAAGRIAEDFARWTDPETVGNRRRLVVSATLARYQDRPDGAQTAALAGELRELCLQDPGNAEARYHLACALYRQAWEIRERIRGAAGRRRRELGEELAEIRKECAGHCLALLGPESAEAAPGTLTDEERREQIRRILKDVRPDDL